MPPHPVSSDWLETGFWFSTNRDARLNSRCPTTARRAAILKAAPAENAAGEELALFSAPGESSAYYFS